MNSSGRAAGTANVTVQEGGSNTITFKPSVGTGKSPNSLDSYWVILTDKGTVNTPFVFNSNTNTIVDNPTPVVTELITSNEVLDQGQFDTISTQPNGGTGPFTVYFKNATNGDVLRTVANVPLDAEVNYTFPVNDLVSNSSGPTFAMIGVVANMVDQGTSVPFIFQSENSSANTTQLNKLTVSAPSEYASYICAGGSGNANVSVLWTPDANDSADSGLPYSSVGRQHSNSCTIYTKSPSLSEVALGINNTNFKLYTSNSMTKVLNQTLNYSVSVNGSTTLIVAACGLSRCTSISPPDRCDTRLILTGKDAHETAYVALCKNQTAGSYNVRANMSGLGGTSIAAYVFANGVQVSNVTGKNITFAVYTRPFTTLTTYALNGTQTDKLMYGKGGFSANAVVTPGAGPFSFAWTLNGANAYNVTINGTDTSNTITGFGGIVAGGNYTYNVSIVDLGTTTHFVLPKVSATFTVEKNNSLNATVVNPKVVSFSNLTTLTFTGMPTIFNQSRWELYVNGTLYGTTNSVITWSEQNQVGVHSFEFVNPGNNNYTAYHVNTTLTVNPPTPTGLITGGGGGGGGGVGGGGSFKPTVLTQSTSNLVCSTILNFTQHNEETLVVLNKTFQVTENYITPTTAGITVGSNTYEMSLNQSQLVGSYNGINYTIKLVKLSYLPIIDTVDIAVCGTVPTSKVAPITAPKNNTAVVVTNVTTQSQAVSGAYNLSKNQSVHFKVNGLDVNVKVTSSSSTKTLHDISISKYNKTAYLAGHSLLGALNISIKPGQNTTVTVTEGYACNADIQSVQPYVLLNGQWTLIKNFSVDAAACQVTFTVLGDPIVALFATEAAPKPASTTQTVSSSSGSAPTSSSPMAVIVVIALAAVAIITAYAYRQMGREGRESKKRKPA